MEGTTAPLPGAALLLQQGAEGDLVGAGRAVERGFQEGGALVLLPPFQQLVILVVVPPRRLVVRVEGSNRGGTRTGERRGVKKTNTSDWRSKRT